MLKKEKSGESSERCVKKVRRMDEKWISLTYDMLFIKIKMILSIGAWVELKWKEKCSANQLAS